MNNISIVIICKSEAAVIEKTIQAALQLTSNIIVVDTGSTDTTLNILNKYPITIINAEWQGFGPTKNIGIHHSTTDWILSLDADERVDAKLITSINSADLTDATIVYNIVFLNYFGITPIKYGEWNGDGHIRLFNKKNAQWNDAAVHETLQFKTKPTVKKLEGFIHHQTVFTQQEMNAKLDNYAKLNAQHYFAKGKGGAAYKKYFSTAFNFIKNYIFKLGFLDGKAGLIVAKENAIYTYKKYLYLQQLQNS